MTVRDALRSATAAAHARLDALAVELDLSDARAYGRFLCAQAGPVFALEEGLEAAGVASVIPDWPARSRRAALQHDLGVLGLVVPRLEAHVTEIFGTLYVLEGSRLGARVLTKRAKDMPDAFLRHGEGLKLWPSFLALLEENISRTDTPLCIQSALSAFSLFEGSFARVLSE